jgi:hypothetical protein
MNVTFVSGYVLSDENKLTSLVLFRFNFLLLAILSFFVPFNVFVSPYRADESSGNAAPAVSVGEGRVSKFGKYTYDISSLSSVPPCECEVITPRHATTASSKP